MSKELTILNNHPQAIQLAGVGIVAARLSADAGGTKSPRFDIYRRRQAGLGEKVHEGLTSEELVATLMGID